MRIIIEIYKYQIKIIEQNEKKTKQDVSLE